MSFINYFRNFIMKSLMYMFIALFVLLSFEKVYSQEYSHPKSIVYDAARDRYLISNNQSGQVLALSNTNEISVFIDGELSSPRGMIIVEDTLFVVDMSVLKGFNLSDGSVVFDYIIPDATKIVDITIDEDKNLFMTDIQQRKLFMYNLIEGPLTPYNFLKSTYPNGIIYDNNKLFVTTYGIPAQIIVFDLKTWAETRYDFTNFNYFDGIVTDGNGNLYVACWEDMMSTDSVGKILKCSIDDINNLTVFKTGFWGPSDIYYNSIKNELAVPHYTGNRVSFIPMTTDVLENNPENQFFKIYQNEANSEIIIRFKNGFDNNLTIQVYNIFGQTIENDVIAPNQREYRINLSKLDAGIYFIRINNNISKFLITK